MKLLSVLQHFVGATAVAAESEERYDSTAKLMRFHDSVLEKSISKQGFIPYAFPLSGTTTVNFTTNSGLMPANGGVCAIAMMVDGHMLLDSVLFRASDTSLVRGPVDFGIYEDRRNNSNSLDLVSGAVGTLASWTSSGAANRTIPVTSPPAYLPPGIYWLVLKNQHATNGMGVGVTGAGTMGLSTWQNNTLTAGVALPSTLNFVTGWSKGATYPGAQLNGRSFGQSTLF